jgi:hypothetical protein
MWDLWRRAWHSFVSETSHPRAIVGSIENSNGPIRHWTHNLPVCSMMSQPAMLSPPPPHSPIQTKLTAFQNYLNLQLYVILLKNVNVRIYKTIILPVVLYGCETWSLTVREEHKLRVFCEEYLDQRGVE